MLVHLLSSPSRTFHVRRIVSAFTNVLSPQSGTRIYRNNHNFTILYNRTKSYYNERRKENMLLQMNTREVHSCNFPDTRSVVALLGLESPSG